MSVYNEALAWLVGLQAGGAVLGSRSKPRPYLLLVANALLVLHAPGCPGLVPMDGFYRCEPGVDGACPEGMSCEWSTEAGEHRCSPDGGSPVCGDGTLDVGEPCDDSDLGGRTCASLGYIGGTLFCTSTCTFDTSQCQADPDCGNDSIDGAEECDGVDLGEATCGTLGLGAGALDCTPACKYDISGCSEPPVCGDGTTAYGETCDDGNTAPCDGCSAVCLVEGCGNSVVECGEACDDGNSVGGDGCSANCLSDESCGNGVLDLDAGEECDLDELGSASCVSLGLGAGILSCDPLTCELDTSGCADASILVEGVIWSPGADLTSTLEVNRFPIPGVAVTAYSAPPAALPITNYCQRCDPPPGGEPSTVSDPVTGSFQLQLAPSQTYFLTLQVGGFRRVSEITTPATGTVSYLWQPGTPRDRATTLPASSDSPVGDQVPSIGVVSANYEDMDPMFNAVGMTYNGVDVHEVSSSVVNDAAQLATFKVLFVPSGENWPGGTGAVLRDWVAAGGVLLVDSFNYDFVEVPWPDFLSWYDGSTECGTAANPTDGSGKCNNWSSYTLNGVAGDAALAAWLALPQVNQGAGLDIQAAWDYIHSLSAGSVGLDPSCGTGPSGEVYQLPDVWISNTDGTPFSSGPVPAMVSWPYECGRVVYSVFHTHTGYQQPYELLLQEKIAFYVMIRLQGCREEICP